MDPATLQVRQTSQTPQVNEIMARVREAAAAGTPLCIRGGGTKDFYGETPVGEVLSTQGLAGVIAYEPSELVITVGAGTPLAGVEALLASQNQCFAFEPPHFGAGATVGGMVSAGLSGPARASVGAVRDYVLGIKLINGKGEHLTFGGQVMKNVAGYDVSRLMAGAMGTLGLLTEVSLKVLPVAVAEATLVFECDQAEALHRLNTWGGQPLPLNASRWENGQLHLRLRGAQAAVDAACQTLGGERLEPQHAQAGWAATREQQLPWFTARNDTQDLWRLSVPQTTPVLDLPGALVEWHGAQRWVRADAQQGAQLRQLAADAGGHATLFIAARAYGTGAAARLPRFSSLKPPLDRIQRELKKQFDPAGIFNPGRLTPEGLGV